MSFMRLIQLVCSLKRQKGSLWILVQGVCVANSYVCVLLAERYMIGS